MVRKNIEIKFKEVNVADIYETQMPVPGAGEVLIKTSYSALSAGTERAVLTGLVYESASEHTGQKFDLTKEYPTSAGGYSGTGVIQKVGEGVTKFKPGDKVMMHGGGHKLYTVRDQSRVLHIPDNVCMREASMTIISGFSLAAVRKAKIQLGESCMVVGLGLLGLFSVQFAKLSGAMPIIALDMNQQRRELALKLGADYAFDPTDTNCREKIMRITHQKGVNSVIEVTGNGEALNQALKNTAKFGRVVLLGCTRLATPVNFYWDVHCPGIQLIGAHSGARPANESSHDSWTEMDDAQAILEYLSAGRLDFKSMITEIHSHGEAFRVYDRLAHDKNFPIGVVFDWTDL
ncbi:MAG: zinc-binding alcohol dehydrogenase [Ruminococcaceae bacterium]|nr:zinc-binding alcohol dehydrogenase [Oscillospiraceae bacterium]